MAHLTLAKGSRGAAEEHYAAACNPPKQGTIRFAGVFEWLVPHPLNGGVTRVASDQCFNYMINIYINGDEVNGEKYDRWFSK
ncbi:hypothetical protein GCM10023166_02900 [Paeniglutamicibacter cryotolerans]